MVTREKMLTESNAFGNIVVSSGKHISYSWSAGYRISTNGSYHWTEESPKEISASGSEINGTLVALDVFPDSFAGAYNAEEEIPTTLTASRRIRRSSAEKEIDEVGFLANLRLSVATSGQCSSSFSTF